MSILDSVSGNTSFAGYLLSRPVATTGVQGYNMTTQSGAFNILTWQVPNDGNLHVVQCFATYFTTGNASPYGAVVSQNTETGSANIPSGFNGSFTAFGFKIDANGYGPVMLMPIILLPGQIYNLQQTAPLPSGAGAVVFASLYSDL